MHERRDIGRVLSDIEQQMKELEIAYEQYFAGVEKREPVRDREALAKRLRHFANRRITQTDLRYRYQNLATRFHSYSGYWDRILRLIDEGRYNRQQGVLAKPRPAAQAPEPEGAPEPAAGSSGKKEFEGIYRDLVAAHQACRMETPARDQIEQFLSRQQDVIREKFGDRPVEFRVDTSGGKPKIRVTAKK